MSYRGMPNYKRRASKILKDTDDGLGRHIASEDDMSVLLGAGASIDYFNHPNPDGLSFHHQVKYKDRIYFAITANPIAPRIRPHKN